MTEQTIEKTTEKNAVKNMTEDILTHVEMRPRFEGNNIMTWIGFKHVMYLAEEALIDHLNQIGLKPRELFEKYGICLEIVEDNARILHALHVDDTVFIDVEPLTKADDQELRYAISMYVNRGDDRLKAYAGKMSVVFRKDDSLGFSVCETEHPLLSKYVHSNLRRRDDLCEGPFRLARANQRGKTIPEPLMSSDKPLIWKSRIPYFYCHGNERLQMSGYLRLMEEAEDLFLEQRGISIWKMLDTKRWIPVVPTAKMQILNEAYMEEDIYTVYTLKNLVKDITYECSMNCYVERNGELIHTATGTITHGYALIENRLDWKLVNIDDNTLKMIQGI